MTREAGKGEITAEFLKEIYDYRDGSFYWKVKFSDKVVVGAEVGTWRGRYRSTKLHGKDYDIHRLVFLWHKGYLPSHIDHMDGDTANNRIENLRAATHAQNMHNSKTPITNTSGYKNVSWKKDKCKWKVEVRMNNKLHFFGYFDDIEKANETAIAARKNLHKEFARHE